MGSTTMAVAAGSGKAAQSVREKFSLEFITQADAEANALKNLLNSAALPDLILFDPDAVPTAPQEVESQPDFSMFDTCVDPVEELRMLFGSVE